VHRWGRGVGSRSKLKKKSDFQAGLRKHISLRTRTRPMHVSYFSREVLVIHIFLLRVSSRYSLCMVTAIIRYYLNRFFIIRLFL